MIVLIAGPAGSGKSTLARSYEQLGYRRDSFAAPVKRAVADIYRLPHDMLAGQTLASREWRELPCPELAHIREGMTPRDALREFAEPLRLSQNLWAKLLARRVSGNTVVDDMRFPAELEEVKRHHNDVIVITCRGEIGTHPSEMCWVDIK
jgi:energy-coupling factor transporter ATP-binding protein EcfA2